MWILFGAQILLKIEICQNKSYVMTQIVQTKQFKWDDV